MNASWVPHSVPGSFIYVISVKYSQEFYVIGIVMKGDMEVHIGEKSVQDQQLVSDRARILTWSKLLPFMECFFFMGQAVIYALFILPHQISRTMKSYILPSLQIRKLESCL